MNVIYYCFTVSLQEKEEEKERVQASWVEENFIFLCLEQKNRHKTNSPYLAALNVVCYWSNGELRSLAKNCSLLSGLFNECYLRQISYRVYYIWIRLFDFFSWFLIEAKIRKIIYMRYFVTFYNQYELLTFYLYYDTNKLKSLR